MRLFTQWPGRERAPAVTLGLLMSLSCHDPTGGEARDSGGTLWRVPLAARDAGLSVPAADGERLYTVGRGVTAYAASDGAGLYSTGGMTYAPANVVARGGRVFAAEAAVHAYDAATGRERWRFQPVTMAPFSRSAADDEAFYFGTSTSARRVYALDAATGAERWSTEIGPEWQYDGYIRGVAVSGDTVYAGAEQDRAANGYLSSGWLVALDKRTGAILWRYSTGTGDEARNVISAPTVAGRLLLASDRDGNAAFAVDRFTGQEVWRFPMDPSYVGPVDAPVVVGDVAYVGSGDTHVYALDLATGRERWRAKLPAAIEALTVCGGGVFASYQGLAVLDRATGRVLRTAYDGEAEFLTSGFATVSDRVYVLGNKYAYALRCP
jgi:outer membrane protein assembly factor BamB